MSPGPHAIERTSDAASMMDVPDIGIEWARWKGPGPLDVPGILSFLRTMNSEGRLVQAFDARGVAGPRHVESAYLHMRRAMNGRRIRLRDPGAVFAIYLSGTDQFERALARVGLQADTEVAVFVSAPAADLKADLERFGFDPVTPPILGELSPDLLQRLGIDARLIKDTPPALREHLVLEHVAMVDLPR